MQEELGKSEDVVTHQQSARIKHGADNSPRRSVSGKSIIAWFALALLALFLWLLRLLGVVELF